MDVTIASVVPHSLSFELKSVIMLCFLVMFKRMKVLVPTATCGGITGRGVSFAMGGGEKSTFTNPHDRKLNKSTSFDLFRTCYSESPCLLVVERIGRQGIGFPLSTGRGTCSGTHAGTEWSLYRSQQHQVSQDKQDTWVIPPHCPAGGITDEKRIVSRGKLAHGKLRLCKHGRTWIGNI
jgi:hypothetical protein